MKRTSVRPVARIRKTVAGFTLAASKHAGAGWQFACAAFPDIARRFGGVDDASDAVAEFERRATEATEGKERA